MRYTNFRIAINHWEHLLCDQAVKVHRDTWQGLNTKGKPEMTTYELSHLQMVVPVANDLPKLEKDIKPNLPWAADHFSERVSGSPLNPGTEWRNWPWGKSADKFRIDPASVGDPGKEPIFDHTYAARYWPKFAGTIPGGILPEERVEALPLRKGIYFPYGDLGDVVDELNDALTTRQAILPVFFPEDTGLRQGRRKPCSIYYHFIVNDSRLDIVYALRSCDIIHHLRDDIYLTVRLLLWVISHLRHEIDPGLFVMHVTNLHAFANDFRELQQRRK